MKRTFPIARIIIVAICLPSVDCIQLFAASSTAPDHQTTHSLSGFLHHLEAFTSPGPLSHVHQQLDNPENCARCHQQDHGLSHNLCLECHKDIAQRISAHMGVHGRFTQDCQVCHVEHKGRDNPLIALDHASFDHSTTRYHLVGHHRELKCDACHATPPEQQSVRARRFIGLSLRCDQCHVTPHKNEFTDRCDRCHSESGWGRQHLNFNHDLMTSFTLTGAHQKLDCVACHSTMHVFNDISPNCASCHQDPHKGQFAGKTCTVCHQTSGWQLQFLRFDHNHDTNFPLTGRHAQLSCDQCHLREQYHPVSTSCSACHTDPHRAALGQDCNRCHTTGGFDHTHVHFNHARQTRFPLTGAHARLTCASCHADNTFKAQGIACTDCHTDPHKQRLGTICAQCHTTQGFGPNHSIFDHNRQTSFTLTALHANTSCAECHADQTFQVRGNTCITCHADVQAFYAGHSPDKSVPVTPDSMFGKVSCQQCHALTDRDASLASVEPHCLKCHDEHYAEFLEQAVALTSQRALRLQRVSSRSAPQQSITARQIIEIDRLAPHNFPLANATLGTH